MYTVYKHTSPSNKVYIGITSQPIQKRWMNGYGYIGNNHFWKAIQKYGWVNFTHEIVACELSKEEACRIEIELIKEYNSIDPNFGYNISTGGENTGAGIPCSDEKKEKIRQSRLGEKHWFYGKHLSEDHRRKISLGLKGLKHSDESKLKYKAVATKLRGKAVRCIETNIIYPSIAEAARANNIHHTAIMHVLKGNHKTAASYHWEYVEKVN